VHAEWRAVFWAMAVLSALSAVLAAVAVPGGTRRAAGRVDLPGALLLAGGLVAAVLPITEGGTWGWGSWRAVGLFAVAVVLLPAWAVTALRSPSPVVQPRVLARPGVAAGALMFAITAGTVGVINSTVPSFLQAPGLAGYGFGASVLGSGLATAGRWPPSTSWSPARSSQTRREQRSAWAAPAVASAAPSPPRSSRRYF
jgi:hypothetical protein